MRQLSEIKGIILVRIVLLTILLLMTACANGVDIASLPKELPGTAKQKYLVGTEDVPLYFGFTPTEEGNVSYDSTDGRIIDGSFVSTTEKASDVRKFYEESLPQLGWQKMQYQLYKRDGEILRLNILEKDNKTHLKFSIRPYL